MLLKIACTILNLSWVQIHKFLKYYSAVQKSICLQTEQKNSFDKSFFFFLIMEKQYTNYLCVGKKKYPPS